MNLEYREKVAAFTPQQKTYFYELFAHFLTVSMRGILFFEGIDDQERIERAKWLNEIAHRITYKIFLQDKNPQTVWTDAEVWEMIGKNTAKHPATGTDVNLALEFAYKYIIDNESDEAESDNS